MSESVAEAVSFTQTDPRTYTSTANVEYSGPGLEHVGYGGFCIAFGINAAAATLSPQQIQSNLQVYSVTGYFTAMATTTLALNAEVTPLRNSRAFATRRVDLYQLGPGQKRTLVVPLTVDFQAKAPTSMLEILPSPAKKYTTPDKSLTNEQTIPYTLGPNATEEQLRQYRNIVPHMRRKVERRVALEVDEEGKVVGDARQSASVMFPPSLPEESGEAITEKTYCHWYRFPKVVSGHLAQVLSLSYVADMGSPQVGPAFARVKRADIAAAASLDFALRIVTSDIDVNRWMLREEKLVAAGDGRTYTEARMFDEQGRMLASMTEQCLLRPREKKKQAKM